MTTLVSVYITTKNRCDMLKAAIESVLTQSHKELDVVVVDDGSSDGTADFLHRLCQREQRVRHIRRDVSGGAPSARNEAIRLADGEFVTGLDDDDLFLPDRVQMLLGYWQLLDTEKGERPACLYTQDWCSADGRTRSASRKLGSVRYDHLFEQNHIGNQIFVPRQALIEAGCFDAALPAWQDLELFMRLLKTGGTARLLDVPLYVFDVSPRTDRVTRQAREKLENAYVRVAEQHADTPRRRQQLYLQLFREGYELHPTFSDWSHFMRLGIWPSGMMQLARAKVRSRLRPS